MKERKSKRMKKLKQFELNTDGNDAYVLNLAYDIDRGIKRKTREIDTEEGRINKRLYEVLTPVKIVVTLLYAYLSQAERPNWCLKYREIKAGLSMASITYTKLDVKLAQTFDQSTCDNADRVFTNWNTDVSDRFLSNVSQLCFQFFFIYMS